MSASEVEEPVMVVRLPGSDAEIQAWLAQFQGPDRVYAAKALSAAIRHDTIWGSSRHESQRPRFSQWPIFRCTIAILIILIASVFFLGRAFGAAGGHINNPDIIYGTVTDTDFTYRHNGPRICSIDYEYEYAGHTYAASTSYESVYCDFYDGASVKLKVERDNPAVSSANFSSPVVGYIGLGVWALFAIPIFLLCLIGMIGDARELLPTAKRVDVWATQAAALLGIDPVGPRGGKAVEFVLDHSLIPVHTTQEGD